MEITWKINKVGVVTKYGRAEFQRHTCESRVIEN